jgi:hypothetical protein
MAKRKTHIAARPNQKKKTPGLWIDTANLPTSLARRKVKPQPLWKMMSSPPEGAQNHYLQLADAVLKRVTFEAPMRVSERLPYLVSKIG